MGIVVKHQRHFKMGEERHDELAYQGGNVADTSGTPDRPAFGWRNGQWLRIEEDGTESPADSYTYGLCVRGLHRTERVARQLQLLRDRVNAYQRLPAACQEAREMLLADFRLLELVVKEIEQEDLR